MFNNIYDSRVYKLFCNRYFLLFLCVNCISAFLMKMYHIRSIREFVANNQFVFIAFMIVHICIFIFEVKASRNEWKIENVFIAIYACMSLLAVIAIPPMKVPDEIGHIIRSYEVSTGAFITPKNQQTDEMGSMLPKEILLFNKYDLPKATWNKLIPVIENANISENKVIVYVPSASLYAPTNYLPQALGMFITRIFTNRLIILYYGGRLLNVLLCGSLLFYAIKLIPFGKLLMCCLALLPMSIQAYNSFSPDGVVISLSALFVAYIIRLRTLNRELDKFDYIRLSVLIFFLALGKVVYFPLCFLVVMLPKEIFRINKLYYRSIFLWCLSSLAIVSSWFAIASRYLIEYTPGVNSFAQIRYVIRHPFMYLCTLATTVIQNCEFYFISLFGNFGWLNIPLPYIFSISLFMMLIVVVLSDDGIVTDKNFSVLKRMLITIASIIFIGIFTALYVQWNKVEAPIIEGVQGRYFLPILPLIGIALKPMKSSLLTDFNYKLLVLSCFAGVDFCALVIMSLYAINHV